MADEPPGLPPRDPHARPEGVDDATIEAAGKVTEAFEWVERARGRLYDFHHLVGHGHGLLVVAIERLEEAGHDEVAALLRRQILGRNVLEGRWTFQVVEEFDATYWEPFRNVEQRVRDTLLAGRRHVSEAEQKEHHRTRGDPHHTRAPGED